MGTLLWIILFTHFPSVRKTWNKMKHLHFKKKTLTFPDLHGKTDTNAASCIQPIFRAFCGKATHLKLPSNLLLHVLLWVKNTKYPIWFHMQMPFRLAQNYGGFLFCVSGLNLLWRRISLNRNQIQGQKMLVTSSVTQINNVALLTAWEVIVTGNSTPVTI